MRLIITIDYHQFVLLEDESFDRTISMFAKLVPVCSEYINGKQVYLHSEQKVPLKFDVVSDENVLVEAPAIAEEDTKEEQ